MLLLWGAGISLRPPDVLHLFLKPHPFILMSIIKMQFIKDWPLNVPEKSVLKKLLLNQIT